MTTTLYRDKLTCGPMPVRPALVRITLRYSAGKAARIDIQESAGLLRESFDELTALTGRGFLGAQQVAASVTAPAPDLLDVHLTGDSLPPDLAVMALRLVISANDNSPEDFQRLLSALDGDRGAALQIYAGTNFAEEVAGLTLVAEGAGPAQAFDPFHLGGQAGPLLQARRLVVPGWGPYCPDAATEDLILRLSGMRAFLPAGAQPDYEPGDEEYFARGDDLILDEISIEETALRAILAMLAPGRTPTFREEGQSDF